MTVELNSVDTIPIERRLEDADDILKSCEDRLQRAEERYTKECRWWHVNGRFSSTHDYWHKREQAEWDVNKIKYAITRLKRMLALVKANRTVIISEESRDLDIFMGYYFKEQA